MAEYYSPWADAAQGAERLGSSVSQIALGLAQQRFQQQMAQQQAAMQYQNMLNQASVGRQRGRLYDAQTALAKANVMLSEQKQKDLERKRQVQGQLGDAAWYAGMVQAGQNQGIDMGARGDIANAQMMGAMGQLPDAARSKLPVNLAQMFQARDPRMQQLLATGTKMTGNVPAGGTMVDTYGGDPLYRSPRTLNQGQTMVEGTGGAPIASGLPPRAPANELRLDQLQASSQDLIGKLVSHGEPPAENSPMFPIYSGATNQLAQVQNLIGAGLQRRQGGTNAPAQADLPSVTTKEQFDSLPKGAKYLGKDGKTYMKP